MISRDHEGDRGAGKEFMTSTKDKCDGSATSEWGVSCRSVVVIGKLEASGRR